ILAVTRLHQIAHNRNLVFRHGPNLHQIKTLHGILAHKLLLGIETESLSHQSCWRSYRPGVSFLLTQSNSSRCPLFREFFLSSLLVSSASHISWYFNRSFAS